MSKFSIKGKVYDGVDVTRLTMKDMLTFSLEVKALGRDITWDDVTRWYDEMGALETDAERARHPEAIWLTATSIWAARRAAGDDVTFSESIDIPAADIVFLPDLEDHKKPAAGKARKPRAASARGSKHPAKKAGAAATRSAGPSSATSSEPFTAD